MSIKNLGTIVQAKKLIPIDDPNKVAQNFQVLSHVLKDVSEEALLSGASFLKLDARQLACMLSSKGLSTELIVSKLASMGLSKEVTKGALNFMGLKTAEIDAAVANVTFSTSTGVATTGLAAFGATLKSVTAGLVTFLTTNPVGWAISAAMAIGAVTLAVDLFSTSFEEANKKYQSASSSYQELSSDLNSLRTEYEHIKSRIDELNGIEVRSDVEQAELDKLETKNELLWAQIEAKERLQRYSARDVASAASDALTEEDTHIAGTTVVDGMEVLQFDRSNIIDRTIAKQKQYNELEQERIQLSKELASLGDDADRATTESYLNRIVAIEGAMADIDEEIVDNLSTISELYEGLFYEDGSIVEGYESLVAAIQSLLGIDGRSVAQKIKDTFYGNLDDNLGGLKGNLANDFNNWIEGLSSEDQQFVYELSLDADSALWSLGEWKEALEEVKKATEEVDEATKSFVDRISGVEALSAGFEQLAAIYKDVSDKSSFDFSNILNNDDFKASFGKLDSYENFIKTIANSPDDISACQSAFNSLVSDYINTSGILDDLTEETRDVTVAMLEQNGVTNAAIIVDRQLALQKERVANASGNLADKTYDEIVALYSEAEAGSVAQQALAELAVQKFLNNDNPIRTSADIDQLIALANTANITAASLQNVLRAKQLMDQADFFIENQMLSA